MRPLIWVIFGFSIFQITGHPQATAPRASINEKNLYTGRSDPIARYQFEGNLDDLAGRSEGGTVLGNALFVTGLDGQAVRMTPDQPARSISIDIRNLNLNRKNDFSVQFWIRTRMDTDSSAVILSKKDFGDRGLASQKKAGWVFYFSRGTWAWNMGSGERRITYERENGNRMPLNDGGWHQLSMAFDCTKDEVRLYYDGDNKAVYKVSDARGFDFTSATGLIIGMDQVKPPPELLPEIEVGAETLQKLVDEFNRLGLGEVEDDQFESLIVDPKGLVGQKGDQMNSANPPVAEETANLEAVERIRAELMANPYTVHQARSFMEVAPILQIYSLVNGEVTIKQSAARDFSEKVRLFQPDFDMDNLMIWDRVLSPEEVRNSYTEYFEPNRSEQKVRLTSFSAAVWNIFHGGKHFTVEKDGWDSRLRIAEMLKQENADVIMMQETYSSGDFIAAELGYYFATTVDPDYLNQGSNISVLSRYPIKELFVPAAAPFNNVGVKVAVSKNQELYVMSNWYGMRSFPTVFDFHESRFDESGSIPTVFSSDFNAVPHTDGGKSAASLTLLEAGLTDAYRSLYPDVDKYPGFTHRSGSRIDQLYYKGKGLKNTSTRTISTWEGGFPSDHFLIISQFDLH